MSSLVTNLKRIPFGDEVYVCKEGENGDILVVVREKNNKYFSLGMSGFTKEVIEYIQDNFESAPFYEIDEEFKKKGYDGC